MLENIVMFSGGKDSTALLLMMIEKNMPVDEIVFFDTGWEFPAMIEHIKKVEKYINRKITILKDVNTMDFYFSEYVKVKGKNKGQKGYAFPDFRNRWCTGKKKTNIKRYLKGRTYIEYQGIAFDEPLRVEKNKEKTNVKYPLFEWGITEKQALEYCYSKGFDWGGLYKQFNRVSCWCCPLKQLDELRSLYNFYPELWQRLKEMQEKSYRQFRNDYTIEELENKFNFAKLQLKLFEG